MTRPTADTTAAARSWLRSEQDLRSLLEKALEDPEIGLVLDRERISPAEASVVVLEDPAVLGALRTSRVRWKSLWEQPSQWPGLGLRSPRLAGAAPAVRVVVAGLIVVAYLALLTVADAATPLWADVLTFFGLFATVGVAVGLAAEDVWRISGSGRPSAAWQGYALNEILRPRLRQFLDERRGADHGTTLSLERVHDLYQDDDAPIVITESGQRLRRVLERSGSDAVAIAGYRGVGKTTSIAAAADGMFSDPGVAPPLAVVASAPSRYDARDFVLHLHAMLARKVVALTERLLRVRPPVPPRWRWRRVATRAGGLAVVLVVAFWVVAALENRSASRMLGILGTYLEALPRNAAELLWIFDDLPLDPALGTPAALLVVVVALAVVGFALDTATYLITRLGAALRTNARARTVPDVAALRVEAVRQLDRTRFLQTYTSGWSGKIGIPLGSSDLGWTRGRQRAEQQLTHPEVVEAFREFAGRSAAVLVRAGAVERILIAVDELDKIAEADRANEFVNDIKGIFGIEGCLFLVAVSEDAISAFERRGIPVRDEFDSAFTEMVRLDPFTLAESRRWMSRRLLGLQVPFGCLCHCLSGGLPRDLRRTTIDLIDVVDDTRRFDLESVASALIDRELDRKAHAFAAAVRRLDDTAEVTAHLADLLLIDEARRPVDLVALAERLAPGEDSAMPRTRWQSACFVLFCATVLEIFTNDVTAAGLDRGVALLARARAQLAVDPHVAWRMVGEVRERCGL
ncbi:hypothetical protein BLA60_20675 [Actinophytocola xinjiangensis]|uniref:KAP-like P-loop domain-containing protein n=1 Tax=Actinophytocola xinjiangensis TaxID=485602 RepID=A0A7Z0WLF8_9PSEU|nr:hypothetical protein [Actinophytocola xinjiangensis]OLF09009.1 hypothetical protein BLA60_20675 [Actinophytocola xinjiangensis]